MTRLRVLFLLVAFAPACTGNLELCASDPCSEERPCDALHRCVRGQCVLPCETVDDCPAGSKYCLDPGGAFPMCVDADGVPGMMCVPSEQR